MCSSHPSLLLSHLCSAILPHKQKLARSPSAPFPLDFLLTSSGYFPIVCHHSLLLLSFVDPSHVFHCLSRSLSPFSPPFSAHSCGLSPQAVMQSYDSCAQSQGLESARQPSRGVTTPRSVGKQQERKEERWGGTKEKKKIEPMREGGKTV